MVDMRNLFSIPQIVQLANATTRDVLLIMVNRDVRPAPGTTNLFDREAVELICGEMALVHDVDGVPEDMR